MSLLGSLGRSPTFFRGITPFYSSPPTEESGERGRGVFTGILRLTDKRKMIEGKRDDVDYDSGERNRESLSMRHGAGVVVSRSAGGRGASR